MKMVLQRNPGKKNHIVKMTRNVDIQNNFEHFASKLILIPPPYSIPKPSANENEIIAKKCELSYKDYSDNPQLDGPYKGIAKLFENKLTNEARLAFRSPGTSYDLVIKSNTSWLISGKDWKDLIGFQEKFQLFFTFYDSNDTFRFNAESDKLRRKAELLQREKEEQLEKERKEKLQRERNKELQIRIEKEKKEWDEFERKYKNKYQLNEARLNIALPEELMEESSNPLQQCWWNLRQEEIEDFQHFYEIRKRQYSDVNDDFLFYLVKDGYITAQKALAETSKKLKTAEKEYLKFLEDKYDSLKSESHLSGSQEERNCCLNIAKIMVKACLIVDPEGRDINMTKELNEWKDWIKKANQIDLPLPPFPGEEKEKEQQEDEIKENCKIEKSRELEESENKNELKEDDSGSEKQVEIHTEVGTKHLTTVSTKTDAETQTLDSLDNADKTTPVMSNSASQTEAEKLIPTMSNSASQTEAPTAGNGIKLPDFNTLVKALNDTLDALLSFHQTYSANAQKEKNQKNLPGQECINTSSTSKVQVNELSETQKTNVENNNLRKHFDCNSNPKCVPSENKSMPSQVFNNINSQIKTLEEKVNALASDFAHFDKKLFIQPQYSKPNPRPYSVKLPYKPPPPAFQNPVVLHSRPNEPPAFPKNIPKLMELKIEPLFPRNPLSFFKPRRIHHQHPVYHLNDKPFYNKELSALYHPHTWRCADVHLQRLVWCSKTHRPRRLERG